MGQMRTKPWLFSLAFLGTACPSQDDAMASWHMILDKCTGDETIDPKKVVYFGPSNQVGPGSLWRRPAGKGWHLRRLLFDIAEHDDLDNVVLRGADSTCTGSVEVSIEMLGGLLANVAKPLAALGAQLGRTPRTVRSGERGRLGQGHAHRRTV